MKLAIMQPYFLPYLGYWQLLSAVDAFVVYDNIQYTKKGWINRNRFLRNGADAVFTLPLQHGQEGLDVCRRFVAADFQPGKLLAQLAGSYRRAPCFREAFPLLESILQSRHRNLFDYIANSIRVVAGYLAIDTPIVVSSTITMDHSLRGEHRVLGLCRAMGAGHYVNAIGGQQLYSKAAFSGQGIALRFLRTRPVAYRQFDHAFVPDLSIVDVMMFNHRDAIRAMLGEYDLV